MFVVLSRSCVICIQPSWNIKENYIRNERNYLNMQPKCSIVAWERRRRRQKKKEKKTFSLILMWDRELIHSLSRCTSGEGPEREEELFLRHGWESLCHVLCLFEIKKMFLFFLTLIFLIYLFSYLFLLLPSLSCLPSYGRSTTFHLPPNFFCQQTTVL